MGRFASFVVLGLGACSFHSGGAASGDGGGDGALIDAPPGTIDSPPDGPCWPFTPTNIDACHLPATVDLAGALAANATFDADNPPVAGATVTQPDGSQLFVVHVASLSLPTGSFTIAGHRMLVIASDGDVTIGATITTTAGAGGACSTVGGGTGEASTATTGGGGGGGGAGGVLDGKDGGDGKGGNHGGKGLKGAKVAIANPGLLSPLHGGCGGGNGGGLNNATDGATGGAGGGALQIVSKTAINLTGSLLAYGYGGGGGLVMRGGGGGGGGGAILLEASTMSLGVTSVVCADGAAGGQGGGASGGAVDIAGSAGNNGACLGGIGAGDIGNLGGGGVGGSGGYGAAKPATAGAVTADTAGGGGGGGGAAGFIRLHSVLAPAANGIATPAPLVD